MQTLNTCFTYGSLMCEDIFAAVTGLDARGVDARLDGYSRHPVIGTDYPGIRLATASSVPGRLYFDLPPLAIERLDRFEGDEYRREAVSVVLADGSQSDAWVYVFDSAQHQRLGDTAWDFDRFLRSGKAQFMQRHPPAPL
jgi:gamma-glutamylcyclotransferase (GGCT)/AIG2-like uncharacterized protein YtfP